MAESHAAEALVAEAAIALAAGARLYCRWLCRSINGRTRAAEMGDFDVALLQNLQISKTRRKTAGTRSARPAGKSAAVLPHANRRSARSQTEQDILRHVQGSVLQKYCALCGCLNVDPLKPQTL